MRVSQIITAILLCSSKVDAFATRSMPRATVDVFSGSALFASISPESEEDDDREKEYARVRRGGGRREYYGDEDGYDRGVYSNDVPDYYDDSEETYDVDDDDEDEDYEDVDDEEYGFFGNAVIPNPLLDSIDPDGAADRFPELARDPWFWIDMLIFVAVLDFLSYAGARESLPTVDWF